MKKIINIRGMFALVLLLILVANAYGQIKVSYVGGEAYFTRNNLRQRITHGMEVKPGDTITTANQSFVALLFDDGSVHKVTANSQYQIQKYSTTDESRFQVFNIVKGKIFSFVSKAFKKSDIKFLTPTAVVGVRGTSFVTQVANNGETTVFMVDGKVDFSAIGASEVIPLGRGEKGNSAGGKVKKAPMSQEDYKEAAKDVPVSLAEALVTEKQVGESEEESESESDKALVRDYVRESTGRVEEQRAVVAESRVWDYQSEKTIGRYRISQVITLPEDNQISIVNHTYDTIDGRQNSLDLGITFEAAVPGISDVLAGTSRNVKQIDWKISVEDKGNRKDELLFSKSHRDNFQEVTFNNRVGSKVSSTDLEIQGANVRVPTSIKFEIDNQEYVFSFDYAYINSAGGKVSGVVLNRDKNFDTYEKILAGDLDTKIHVQALIPEGGVGNVIPKGMSDNLGQPIPYSFDIILINNFLFPLFNNIAS